MKSIQFFFLLIILPVTTYAQVNYKKADSIASVVQFSSIEKLHYNLTANLKSDEEKLRSFYYWITHNINYDVNEWIHPSGNYAQQQAVNVLKNKKAVCHGYSELFKALCDLSGIKCFLVSGYIKRNSEFIAEGHTWNVVFVNDKWLPVDATWGAGGVDEKRKFVKVFDEKYFLASPELFLMDHYPFDPAWQLVPYPVTLNVYKKNDWNYSDKPSASRYNYNDTIAEWMKYDSIPRRLLSAQRMVRLNPDDVESKRELSYAMLDAAQEESMKGSAILEELYPKTKNGQTTATRKNLPANEFNNLLDSAYSHFNKAESILKDVVVTSQHDRNDKENAMKILKHNMEVIRSERR